MYKFAKLLIYVNQKIIYKQNILLTNSQCKVSTLKLKTYKLIYSHTHFLMGLPPSKGVL
jgi:hypothetical protein